MELTAETWRAVQASAAVRRTRPGAARLKDVLLVAA